MGNAYKVIGFTSENKGLKYLYCEKTEIDNTMDDLENEIADRWKYEIKHNYSMTVTEENITLEEGQTKQLVVSITDTVDNKTESVGNPTIIYTSNDSNIVKVDDNGLITAIGEGTSTIKVKFENIEKIINIKVVKPLPITTTYEFKTITLDGNNFAEANINIDNGTSKVLKVTEVTKTTTQGDNSNIEVINNPIVAYSVDNSNVTVDADGKITGVGAGNSVLTISYENITKQINITVNDSVKLEITGSDKIYLGRTRTYTSNIPVVWKIEDVNNDGKVVTPWVTITTSQTDTSVTVQCTDKWIFGNDGRSKYFILTATDKNNSNNIVEKKIKITSY